MSLTSNFEIYKLKDVAEENVADVLTAHGFSVVTRKNAPENFEQVTPRVELKCQIGEATGRRKVIDGMLRFDAWRVQIAAQVVSQPVPDGTYNFTHENMVAMLRMCMAGMAQLSWGNEAQFPTVYFAEGFRETGTQDNLRTDEDLEFSAMGWEGIICLRASAWN